MTTLAREELVLLIRDRLTAEVGRHHPLRVAIDGPDAAGKTMLAADLEVSLTGVRPVIRVSIDDFHLPRRVRSRRGDLDPAGYYHDSFDLTALVEDVLVPLGPAGNRRFRPAIFDFRADRPVAVETGVATDDAVLLVDGVFLLRPELLTHWDYRIHLHVEPAVSLHRALRRDRGLFGSQQELIERYRQRYLPGQALYRDEAGPHQHCDLLLDMTDPLCPSVVHSRS